MENGELQCKFCLEQFKTDLEWRQHIRMRHDAKVFTCGLCPIVYYSKNEYMEHFNSAHKSDYNRHTCSYCGVSYKWFKFLQKHIQKLHSVDKLIQCSKCGEEFYNSMAYETHLKLKHAPGRKMHKCGKCFRSFTAKAFVQLHHKFDHNPGGLKHFREYVRENLNLSEDYLTTMKKCVKCDLKFSSALYLFKHFKNAHNDTKFYKCCKCDDAIYNSRSGLSIHMYFEHGVSREHTCGKCSVGYFEPPERNQDKTPCNEVNDHTDDARANDLPPWSKLFVRNDLPADIELTNATDEEVNNLKCNIKSLFHILSTIPPSQLRGNNVGDRTESIFSINKLRGRDNKRLYLSNTVQELRVDNDKNLSVDAVSNRNQSVNDVVVDDSNKVETNSVVKNRKFKVKFQCKECPKTFSLKKALKVHIAKEHKSADVTDATNDVVDNDMCNNLAIEDVWPLLDTPAGYPKEDDLLMEISSDSLTDISKNTVLSSPNTTTNSHITNYICNICHLTFDDQVFLLNHLTESHSNAENIDTIYKCVACSDAFASEDMLSSHMRTHFQINKVILPNICHKCNKVFNDKRGLYLHQLRSHGIKTTYSCKKCNFKHTNKRKLRNHPCVPLKIEPKIHDKENSTKQIDYHKIKKELLLMCKKELHLKKSGNPKRLYKCLKCENKFPKRVLLLNHIRNDHKIHLFKLYKCETCFAVFKMEDKLQQHIKLKHKPASKLPLIKINKSKMSPIKINNQKLPAILSNIFHKNGMMYNCKICQSYFPSNELLQRHIQWEHTTNVNLHKCGQCSEVLYSVEDLELHVSNSHNKEGIRKWKKKIVIDYEQQTDV